MPKKKLAIVNRFLNEYIYSVLYSVTNEQKKKLSPATLRILSTPARAKNFAIHGTELQKKVVLTELGKNWATIIMDDKVHSVHQLKQMLVKVNEGQTAAGIQHVVKEGIFITTDKQTSFIMGLAAQTISHSNYLMNLDLLKTGHALKKWRKHIADGRDADVLEGEEYIEIIDKLILNAITTCYYSEGFLGISEKELLFLEYMCINRHLYIDKERLMINFKGAIKSGSATAALKRLFAANHIKKHINANPIKYTITASGIEVVTRFRNRILNTIN